MKISNKATGTKFEEEFADRLSAEGFWVHRFQDNKNGQPCDVVAARNGETYLVDCKDCQKDVFELRRMEENQYNAMLLFHMTGNSRGMFAVRFQGAQVYLVDFQVLKHLKNKGRKTIPKSAMPTYGRTLESWLDELNVTRAGDNNGCGDWT